MSSSRSVCSRHAKGIPDAQHLQETHAILHDLCQQEHSVSMLSQHTGRLLHGE